jgi:hypothetical protein
MSLFSWFSPARKGRSDARYSVLADSAFSRMDSTKPVSGAQHQPHAPAPGSQRKQERMAQREQLYGVVREAMVRAGVLSSSYKFKVLSLDAHGRQYMVMVDLAHGAVGNTGRLAEIEAMVAQTARAKYDILVTAVYWRANEHVSVGDPQPAGQRPPQVSQPAPLLAEPAPRRSHSRPAPLDNVSRPAELRAAPVEPLQADEVAAFKKALDAGLRGEQALVAASRAQQNYTLLTGFEDTEMATDADADAHRLSGTQFGAMR